MAANNKSQQPQRMSHEQRHQRRREMAEAVKRGAKLSDVALRYGVAFETVRQACLTFGIKLAPGTAGVINRKRPATTAA